MFGLSKRGAPRGPKPVPGPATRFALVWVAIIAVFIMILASVLVYLLQSDWCAVAIGNAQYVNGRPDVAITGCIELLKLQVGALATNSWITIGVLGGVLVVLMVISVARGRASIHAPGGFGIDVGGGADSAAAGAQEATNAAQQVADQLQGEQP